jgi:hypothetical protein
MRDDKQGKGQESQQGSPRPCSRTKLMLHVHSNYVGGGQEQNEINNDATLCSLSDQRPSVAGNSVWWRSVSARGNQSTNFDRGAREHFRG